jgi:HAMP domain-containing protein
VSCSWDAPSLQQLAASAAVWFEVRKGVLPGTLESATTAQIIESARTLATDDHRLLRSSRALSIAFKDMMQRKLDFVIRAQVVSVVLSALFGVVAFMLMRRHVLRPLAGVEHLARRVISGDLGTQVPVAGGREIAAIGVALNRLSQRMQLLFGLAERSAGGLTTGELLDSLRADLAAHVPIDLVAVAFCDDEDGRGWRMLRSSGSSPEALSDGTALGVHGPATEAVRELGTRGHRAGFGSLMTIELQIGAGNAAVLMFAARGAGAYPDEAAALLRTVASHVQSQLERTLSTEALVVAAVDGLAKLAESRDPETGDHLLRMSLYSALVATELGRTGRYTERIDVRFVDDLRRFAPMHDIGKVGISDSILLKPGRLTDAERADMCRHPTRWDGMGYPNGLAGESIPLSARIVAVADVFDALTSRRPYKEAWSVERALATIDADAGSHFDPEVVAALHRTLPEVLAIHERLKHVQPAVTPPARPDRPGGSVRLGLDAERHQHPGDHVVGRDHGDELERLAVVGQRGAHGREGGVLDAHVAGHLVGQRQGRTLGRVEAHRVERGRERLSHRRELRLGAAGLHEQRRMVAPFVLGAVEHGHHAHRQLLELRRQREFASHRTHHAVPPHRDRRAVQQHAVEVEQRAAAARADRFDDLARLDDVAGNVGNPCHRRSRVEAFH